MNSKFELASLIATDTAKAALAGALGGLVRWVTLRDDWREGAASLIVGTICAVYLGPLAIPMMEPSVGKIMPPDDVDRFTSFIVGLGGISLASFVIGVFTRHSQQTEVAENDSE